MKGTTPHHMHSLSFMGMATFWGQLRPTHVQRTGWCWVVAAAMKVMRANSMCSEFPVIVICSLLTLCLSLSLFLLFNLVTDENSESESDTEEKLKGENKKINNTFTYSSRIVDA